MEDQHECVWCRVPVQAEGYTCDFECYATWYAWAYSERLADAGGGVVLLLGEAETAPLDIIEQPWYNAETDRRP